MMPDPARSGLPRICLYVLGLAWTVPFLQPYHRFPITAFYNELLQGDGFGLFGESGFVLQAVTDARFAFVKTDMPLEKRAMDRAGTKQLMRDRVGDSQIALREKRMDRSAACDVRVVRVARSIILISGFFNRRSSIREKSTGCISAMLLPHSTNTSAWSISS